MLPGPCLWFGRTVRRARHDACKSVSVWQRPPILIVSGHLDGQDGYVRFLRDLRIPVVGVDSCDEASLAIRLFPVRAALVDVLAPADWESCQGLRERLPSAIPIIVLSPAGSVDAQSRQLARRIGCSDVLATPCHPETLVTALDRATVGESSPVGSAFRLRAKRFGGPPQPWRRLVRRKPRSVSDG